MAKLQVQGLRKAINSDSTSIGTVKLSINSFVPVSTLNDKTNLSELISKDKPNNLTLGTDNKLLVANAQTNLTAIYLLNRGELV